MKAEEKIAGGKLVCVEVEASGGAIRRLRITGDFFLHPEERIGSLEGSLAGIPLSRPEGEMAVILQKALGDGVLIGATCADIARLVRKAVG